MNLYFISYILGKLSVFCSVIMCMPLVMSLVLQEENIEGFIIPVVICFSIGALMLYYGRMEQDNLNVREGIAVTVAAWIMMGLYGTIPFLWHGYLNVENAFFESVSGITATGGTVIDSIETLPSSLILWRSMTHWVGGLGIIVIFIALLPQIGKRAATLYNAEVTGTTSEKIVPRLKKTALVLFKIYCLFTLTAFTVLILNGMSVFDALNHAMSMIATGGFSSRDSSIAYFESWQIEAWCDFFMILSGGSFGLYFMVYKRGLSVLLRDSEFKFYLLMVAVFSFLIVANLTLTGTFSPTESVRYAVFQVASIVTTTGFVSNDFEQWPTFSKFCLLMLMLTGGCAGSTAGGLKMGRLLLLGKIAYSVVVKILHPQNIYHVMMNKKQVSQNVVNGVCRFFFLYIMIAVIASLILVWDGVDMFDAIATCISIISNVGPAFGAAGACETYSDLPQISKFVLCMLMIIGRLELFTVLALLRSDFWQVNNKW